MLAVIGGMCAVPAAGSEEVLEHMRSLLGHALHVRLSSLEDFVLLSQVLVQLQNRRDVATTIAVIRRGPDSHDLLPEHELVALHHELVGARNQIDIVVVTEGFDHVAAEQETGTAG